MNDYSFDINRFKDKLHSVADNNKVEPVTVVHPHSQPLEYYNTTSTQSLVALLNKTQTMDNADVFIQTLKSKYSDGAQMDQSNPIDLNDILKKYAF